MLSEDRRDPLLLGHFAYGGVSLLLPDKNPLDDPQTMDEGLQAAHKRLKEDSAFKPQPQRKPH